MSTREPSGKYAVLFSGIVLLLLLTGLVGGESASADDYSKDALKAGSWSLQFGIQSYFRLGAADGFLISCKRHYSPNSAIRLGLTVSGDLTENERDDRRNQGQRSVYSEDDSYRVSFDLVAAYVHYANPQRRVKLYYGFGPMVGGSRSRYDSKSTENQSGVRSTAANWRYSYSVYAGLRALLGAEWFIAENISLFADYEVSIRYLYDYGGYSSRGRFNSEIRRRIEFNPRGVLFGLSVYF